MTLGWSEVVGRIRAGENETTEFKLWSAFPNKVAVALCALANTRGGLLILGVADDGGVVGVSESLDEAQEKLTSLLQSGLSAPLGATLGVGIQDGHQVLWAQVPRTRGPEPLRCKGRVYVRRGRASVEPSPSELQELYNIFGFVVTEEQVLSSSSIRDIDDEAFRRFLERQGLEVSEEPTLSLDSDLRSRCVGVDMDGELVLTVYGALAFGRNPQRFLPLASAWVDCVAYSGTDRATEVILHGEAKGRLDEQVERATGWFKALGSDEDYEGIHRRDTLFVPERAFREAVVNAVAHRDYAITGSKVLVERFSDRVVVTSPGALPNHMTAEIALAGGAPRSRNQLIAHFLLVSRLMEQRGRGFAIMRREMGAFNGTVPELENSPEGGFVRVTLRRTPAGTR